MRNMMIALLILGLAACGASDEAGMDRGSTGGAPQAPGGDGNGGSGGGGTVDPEPEAPAPVSAPQAGVHYVFIADADLDALVRIDAVTLTVDLIEVGSRPDVLAVFPGTDTVAVLAPGSAELSVVDAAPGAEPVVRTVPVPSGYNAIALSPDGDAAIAWFDAARDTEAELGPLQSVSLVRTGGADAEASTLSVGFEPRQVVFTADGATAFVVSRTSISRIDVKKAGEDEVPEVIPLTTDPLDDAVEREVQIAPDGKTAVVRVLGAAQLVVMPLDGSEPTTVELPGQPTDLDLLHDGSRALAVLKDTGQVALLNLDVPGDEDSLVVVDVPGPHMGVAHLTEDDTLAVLSTADAQVESVVAFDLATLDSRPLALQKAVAAVATTPDGRWAVVIHQQTGNGSPKNGTAAAKVDAEVDAAPGYSVVDLDAGFAKLFLTEFPVTQVAFAPEDGKAYALLPSPSGGAHAVAEVRLAPLLERTIPLVSPPVHLVPVPAAHRMAISQQHQSGRVTFLDTASQSSSTVTGFELNALID